MKILSGSFAECYYFSWANINYSHYKDMRR